MAGKSFASAEWIISAILMLRLASSLLCTISPDLVRIVLSRATVYHVRTFFRLQIYRQEDESLTWAGWGGVVQYWVCLPHSGRLYTPNATRRALQRIASHRSPRPLRLLYVIPDDGHSHACHHFPFTFFPSSSHLSFLLHRKAKYLLKTRSVACPCNVCIDTLCCPPD